MSAPSIACPPPPPCPRPRHYHLLTWVVITLLWCWLWYILHTVGWHELDSIRTRCKSSWLHLVDVDAAGADAVGGEDILTRGTWPLCVCLAMNWLTRFAWSAPPLPGNLNLVASAHRLLCLSMSSSPLPPPCPNNYDRRLSHDQFALHQLSVCVCFNLISKHTHTRILYKLFAQSIEHTKPEQIKLKQLAAASCLPVLLCQFVALFGAI